ncbi:unnamed protein product [Laminaria digitata]
MVDVYRRRCSHDSCRMYSSFNVKGSKTAVYCKKHACDGVVDVRRKNCLHNSCTRRPSFSIDSGKIGVYCKQHTNGGMLKATPNIIRKRCLHSSCMTRPWWGVLSQSTPTACALHKTLLVGLPGGPVICFGATCAFTGCKKLSRWGLDGEQPTHCPEHGPLEDGLTCTVRTARKKSNRSMNSIPPYDAVRGPSPRVKAECFY